MTVREVIKLIEAAGWQHVRTKGSHRQFKHLVLPRRLMRYAVIIEKGDSSYGAYVPDLPGCVAVGESQDEVKRLIAEAVEFHLEGMRGSGEPIPNPTSEVD